MIDWLIVMVTVPVLVRKSLSPLYTAVIVSVPPGRPGVLQEAVATPLVLVPRVPVPIWSASSIAPS